MAMSHTFIKLVLALVLVPTIAYAGEYIVGDADGWKPGVNYAAWAKDKVFTVGDTLVFKYTAGAHNVYQATQAEYARCVVPPEGVALTSGNDQVTLKSSGPRWFMCGVTGHCQLGQKLAITVVDAEAPSPGPAPAPSPAYDHADVMP